MKTKNLTAEVGVIIGRFQVPELHSEHKKLIQNVLDNHPRVLIFLGLSPCKSTFNNPLDFQARRAMLNSEFPSVEVYYIEDRATNEIWSKDLDRQIERQIGPGKKVILYGGRDSFVPLYCGKFPTVELVPDVVVSGKEIRKNVGMKSKNTKEFREGVIWSVENQWPSTLSTVDVAIINYETQEMLLARKPDETLLRFVGGFSNVNSPSYEEDVKREVNEETGLEISEPMYIGSTLIDDWRYRNEQNKIKTLFFYSEYVFGAAKANDDISEIRWLKIESVNEDMMVPEHRRLLRMLKEFLKTKSHLIPRENNPKE